MLWPSGFVTHREGVPADQIMTLTEPKLVAVTPRTAAADGKSTVSVVVTPAKSDGTPIGPGASVTIDSTAGTWQAAVVDRGDGSYERTLVAPSAAALAVIRVTIGGVALTLHPRVEFR